jgi:hypothetical protein
MHIQCGFRQGRSTLDHLVRFETFIRNAFIFFDLEKVYDTTWKYGILKDFFDMGLKGKRKASIDQSIHGFTHASS